MLRDNVGYTCEVKTAHNYAKESGVISRNHWEIGGNSWEIPGKFVNFGEIWGKFWGKIGEFRGNSGEIGGKFWRNCGKLGENW